MDTIIIPTRTIITTSILTIMGTTTITMSTITIMETATSTLTYRKAR
jgi:hypothetical protein